MRIDALRVVAYQAPVLVLQVDCGKGTYIRSLAHDLGQRLGCGAHLSALVRLRSGRFRLEDAITLDDLALAVEFGYLDRFLYAADETVLDQPAVILGPERATNIRQGKGLAMTPAPAGSRRTRALPRLRSGRRIPGPGAVGSPGRMVAAPQGVQAMQLIQDLSQLAPDGGVVLTMGVFDGVHLGHRHLIGQVVGRARQLGCRSGVITFHPHPAAVIRGERLPIMTTPQERLYLIRQLDADVVINLPFTAELSQPHRPGVHGAHPRAPAAAGAVDRPGLRAGPRPRGQRGPAAPSWARRWGTPCTRCRPWCWTARWSPAPASGRCLPPATWPRPGACLGHCFSFSGPVIAGARRGRTLGYPTANLSATADRALPADGIYACRAVIGEPRQFCGERQGKRPGRPLYPAVVNVGTRPTFDNGARLVEAYLVGFSGDIYGQTLTLHFVERLRGEMRFPDAASLVRQIDQDVVQAQQVLATDTTCPLL